MTSSSSHKRPTHVLLGSVVLVLSLVVMQLSVNRTQLRHVVTLSEDDSRRRMTTGSVVTVRPREEVEDDTNHNHTTTLPLPLCSSEQLQSGQWLPITLSQPPYISKTTHLRCDNRTAEYYETHPFETHTWKPEEKCVFADFDETDFCNRLQSTTVSIIGDSLSWEHYSSLLQILHQRVHQMDQHRSKNRNSNHIQYACGTKRVKFVYRNDARLQYVADSIAADFPIVLVLNRGAHYVNDTVLMEQMQETVQALQVWQGACQRRNLTCHLYWRTTVPGHLNCQTATQPTQDLQEMEAWINNPNNYDNITINYHWYDFAHQNKLILQLLSDAQLSLTVLPAYHINSLRPDLHRSHQNDCLHNCYPGVMDVYSQLLGHFLKRERTLQKQQDYLLIYQQAFLKYQQRIKDQNVTTTMATETDKTAATTTV